MLVLWSLARALAGADVILMSGAALLVSLGILSPRFPAIRDLTGSFGNEGVLTVAVGPDQRLRAGAPVVYPF